QAKLDERWPVTVRAHLRHGLGQRAQARVATCEHVRVVPGVVAGLVEEAVLPGVEVYAHLEAADVMPHTRAGVEDVDVLGAHGDGGFVHADAGNHAVAHHAPDALDAPLV